MATQTLTYKATATAAPSYTKLTIPNATTIPRTQSVESIKLIGRNPSPPPSPAKLQRSSSASEMLALVGLANLQRLHICASEPSSSSGGLDSSPAAASAAADDDENTASSSDSEECETPDQVSPPYTRPASPIGYIYDFDSEDDDSWDIRKVKYTAGAELAPCYARTGAGSAAEESSAANSLRSSFSDSEDDEDEEEEDDGMMISNKKRSWSPGTPAIEKVEYHWNTPTTSTASSSATSSTVTTPLTPPEEDEDGYFNDDGDDDDDMVGSEFDAGEVWPDEMDSDDFPFLHSWPHSWIWTPPSDAPSTYANPTPNPLPMIHFHYVESQVPDQSSWTPIQDSKFGNSLTVPGHRAYNCAEPTPTKARLPTPILRVAPMQQLCEGARVEYDDKLGRRAVRVPDLKEQREMGLYSVPSVSTSSSSSSSSSQKKGRGRARSRVRGMADDDDDYDEPQVEEGRGRGRSSGRKMTVQSARHFVLSSIREADDGDEEGDEEPFVYDGVSGRASTRLSRWD